MWRAPGTLVAIGAMRLSTEPSPSRLARDQRGIATLHAAFDAGVTLVDTTDSYALDERDIGHNERLTARALAEWRGDRQRITVITKGGLTRPGGRWVPDGRARHLSEACATPLDCRRFRSLSCTRRIQRYADCADCADSRIAQILFS